MESLIKHYNKVLLDIFQSGRGDVFDFLDSKGITKGDIKSRFLAYIPDRDILPKFAAINSDFYTSIGLLDSQGWTVHGRIISHLKDINGNISVLSSANIIDDIFSPKCINICNLGDDEKSYRRIDDAPIVFCGYDLNSIDLKHQLSAFYEEVSCKFGIQSAMRAYLILLKKRLKTFADAGEFLYNVRNFGLSRHRFVEYALAFWWLDWHRKGLVKSGSENFIFSDLITDLEGCKLSEGKALIKVKLKNKRGAFIGYDKKMIDLYETAIHKVCKIFVEEEIKWQQ